MRTTTDDSIKSYDYLIKDLLGSCRNYGLFDNKALILIGYILLLQKYGKLTKGIDPNQFLALERELIYEGEIDEISKLDSVTHDLTTFRVPLLESILRITELFDWTQCSPDIIFERLLFLSYSQQRCCVYQPKEVTSLVISLADLEDSSMKRVYNPFAGIAEFGLHTSNYYGQEFNREIWALGKIRLLLNDILCQYKNENSFTKWQENNSFNAIISILPLGLKMDRRNKYVDDVYSNLSFEHPTIDGVFFEKSLKSISCTGKIIGVISPNFLYDSSHKAVIFKQYLVETGYISKVILLPNNLFPNTSIPVVVVELNQIPNDNIMMVDASTMYKEGKRTSILDVETVKHAINDINQKYVRLINREEVANNEYNLLPSRYFLEDIPLPDGYKAVKLGDIANIYLGEKVVSDNIQGKVVGIANLSSDPIAYEKSEDDFRIVHIKKGFRKITSPVLLLSKIRNLKPTFFAASFESPIYVAPHILALTVNLDDVYMPYLVSELAQKSEIAHKGSIIPNISKKDILGLTLHIPPIDIQRSIHEKTLFVNKEAKLQELGLENMLRRQKNDFIEEIRIKKHNLAQYLAEISSSVSSLSKFIENKGIGTELISQRMNISLSDHISKLSLSVEEMNNKLELLTRESVFGESKIIDINKILKKFKSTSSYSIEYDFDQESIKSKNVNVNMAEDDFKEVIHHIISNAVKHGFADANINNIIRINLSYNITEDMYVVKVSNNGKPMPKGMDSRRYGIKGEIAGITGNEGIGGYRVKSIIEHFNGNYSIENTTGIFPVEISIKLPKYE